VGEVLFADSLEFRNTLLSVFVGRPAALFFVVWILFGHFLIISVFLAFIVQGFKLNDCITEKDALMHKYLRQVVHANLVKLCTPCAMIHTIPNV
jgi:hypothetical protein